MNRYLLALVFAVCSLAVSAQEAPETMLTPDQELAALQTAGQLGLRIYRHDRAAAVATDAGLKLRKLRRDKRLSGWITEEREGRIMVTFLGREPAALYRVSVSMDGVAGPVTSLKAPLALTPHEAGAAAARAAALGSGFEPCSDKYNTVVLPSAAADDDRWTVYLIPGVTENDTVPVGGTYRMEVERGQVTAQRGFTRTCIALKDGPNVLAHMITHVLDPIPTEAHVFWSLWAKKPMYVMTPEDGTLWRVDGDQITRVEREAEDAEGF